MTALDGGAAGAFMRSLQLRTAQTGPAPTSFVAVSAHTLARELTLLASPRHAALYDFGGFDPVLRTLNYDAPGAPALAEPLAERLRAQGWAVSISTAGGLDHGLWTPLRHGWPQANMPVLPLAWNPGLAPAELMRLGADMANALEDQTWLLASGSITHNLRLYAQSGWPMDAPELPASREFRQWWAQRTEAGDWETLCDWKRSAPHATLMHPTDEHLLPFFVAAGAAQARHARPSRWFEGAQHGVIGMDSYAFIKPAAD